MSDMKLEMTGDWNRAGLYFKNLSVNLAPTFQAEMQEDGELVLQKMKDHITHQDLNWTPLSPKTIELKNGDSTIYVETGTLFDSLSVRKIKSTVSGSTYFIGASPWKRHKPSGAKLSDIMIWLEYGTDKIPPRPLIRPTIDEVKDILEKHWEELFADLVEVD